MNRAVINKYLAHFMIACIFMLPDHPVFPCTFPPLGFELRNVDRELRVGRLGKTLRIYVRREKT